jgi:hypothetical protein
MAKGLSRKEITYAKQMMDVHVRTMFMKMISITWVRRPASPYLSVKQANI